MMNNYIEKAKEEKESNEISNNKEKQNKTLKPLLPLISQNKRKSQNKSSQPSENSDNSVNNLSNNNNNSTSINSNSPSKGENKHNNILHILCEFGLSEYIRKLYNLGYDIKDIKKIGNLTIKEFEDLLSNLKMFPGHKIKMYNFYEYLKKIKRNKEINRKKTRENIDNKNNVCTIKGGLNKIKNKNIQANSFLKYPINLANDMENNMLYDDSYNYKPFKIENDGNDIDQMIKFYEMKDESEDKKSTNKTVQQENNSINNVDNSNVTNNNNNNNISLNNNIELLYINKCGSCSDIKKCANNKNIKRNLVRLNKYPENNNVFPDDNDVIENKKLNQTTNSKFKLPSLTSYKKSKKARTVIEKIPNSKNQNNCKQSKEELSKNISKVQKVIEKKIPNEKEKINNNKIVIDTKDKEQIPQSQNQTVEMNNTNKEALPKEKNNETLNKATTNNDDNINKIKHSKDDESKESTIITKEKNDIIANSKQLNRPSTPRKPNQTNIIHHGYFTGSIEDYLLEASSLRLNKSHDKSYLSQTIEKFDPDYMCKCLGLAIMNLIDQGKGKEHITDQEKYEYPTELFARNKTKFTFYYHLFNENFQLITDFFNAENTIDNIQMSILDRLYSKNDETNIRKDRENISFVSHFARKEDKDLINKEQEHKINYINNIYSDNKFNLFNKYSDIEKELMYIDEFFSLSGASKNKKDRYKNYNQKTKEILGKELSFIDEVSVETSKVVTLVNNASQSIKEGDLKEINKDKNDVNKVNEVNKDKTKGENDVGIEKNKKTLAMDADNNIKCDKLKEDANIQKEESKNNMVENNNEISKENNKEQGLIENQKDESQANDNDKKTLEIPSLPPLDKENESNSIIKSEETVINNPQDSTPNKANPEEESSNKIINKDNKSDQIKQEEVIENPSSNNDTKLEKEQIDNSKNPNKDEIKEDKNQKDPDTSMESTYLIDIPSSTNLKSFLLESSLIFDEEFEYLTSSIQKKTFKPLPDPDQIYEFISKIYAMTKMEKEIIIISLIYIERFIFNTGILITSRNWRKLIFTSMLIASEIWDDDSFEIKHFAALFPFLYIGEINQLERTFLELINYRTLVKYSEYAKYYIIIKTLSLTYHYDGKGDTRVPSKKIMQIQEYAFQLQKRVKNKYLLSYSF